MPRFERDAEGTGVIFFLEDDVGVALQGNTETRATAQLWRADDPSTRTAPIVGHILGETFRSRLVELATEKFGTEFDDTYLARLRDGLGQIATAFNQGTDEETGRAVREFLSVKGPSRPILLLRYAQAAEYFHDPGEEVYATVPQDLRKETWSLRSRGFKRWLRYTFYYHEKQRLGGVQEPAPLPESVITNVVKQLEAKALFEGARREVNLRVAETDGKIYLDLCNRKWGVVEISSGGWRVADASDVPVRFIRSKGMGELPLPDRDGFGSIDPLRQLLNLQGEEGERSFRLILAWLMQALRARGPYPVLVLLGERGSAKSTAARILRSLVDPSRVPLRTMPRNPRDLYIDAVSSWTISLDNVSSLPKWLSDTLCMLATGGGFSTRTLFTDREQEIDSVEVEALPRMGDFASWAVATEVALGGEPGSFMKALGASDEEGARQALEASPLAEPIYQLAQDNPDGWQGTASEMLAELREYADEELQHTKGLPKGANVLSNRLKRLAPLFWEVWQIEIKQLSRADGQGSKPWSVRPRKATE